VGEQLTPPDDGEAAAANGPPLGLGGFVPVLLALAGFVTAFAVLRFGNDGFVTDFGALGCAADAARPPAPFTGTSQYRLWVLLICAQTALWFALSAPLLASLLAKGTRARLLAPGVWLKMAALLLFLAWVSRLPVAYQRPFEGMAGLHPWHVYKMSFFGFVGGVVAVLAIVGLWATQAALKEAEGGPAREPGGGVRDFLALRSTLELYLFAAGVIIGAATLATGALRQAVTAACPPAEKQFMVQDVLGYGLAFSLLLALVYAPAHAQLARTRSALREALVPLPESAPAPGAKFWNDWNSERRAVTELLHANAGLFASLAGALSILTPLLGSLVSMLLGGEGE
jgi:hypothetical protein